MQISICLALVVGVAAYAMNAAAQGSPDVEESHASSSMPLGARALAQADAPTAPRLGDVGPAAVTDPAEPRDGASDTPNNADEPPEQDLSGVEIRVGAGYSRGVGTFRYDDPLARYARDSLGLELLIGYRLNGYVELGGYLNYGAVLGPLLGTVTDRCAAQDPCSGDNVRAGVQVAIHILPAGPVDPWVSYGIGYDQLRMDSGHVGGEGTTWEYVDTSKGIEIARLQAGLDLHLASFASIGPFLSYSLGDYVHFQYEGLVNGSPQSPYDSNDGCNRLHGWLSAGLSGALTL